MIVGSSAGALIGLQFVVVTLISQLPGLRRGADVSATFSTPTTVYFVSALILAGVMAVPWHTLLPVSVALAVCGVVGLLFTAVTTRRLSRQKMHEPEFEDWLFHSILPLAAFAVLTAAVVFLGQKNALFGIAVAAMLLLLIGIHNARDTVTYHVFVMRKEHED